MARSYRKDFWDQQPVRVEVWSEKGTIRGVLKPVLDHYAVGFRVMHGFASATAVNDVAEAADARGRPLVALYVGDYDPSGLYMSERDLPQRLAAAHLVIGRSGASTVAELAAIGRPSILVPYPYAADDHQMANARAFEPSECFVSGSEAESASLSKRWSSSRSRRRVWRRWV